MIRKLLPLAAAAVALPAAAMAAPPRHGAEIVLVPVPVAFTATPVQFGAPIVPAALIRQVEALQQSMQAQMAALEQLAASPFAMPQFAMPGIPARGGITRVSMVSVGGPNGVCNEQMEIVPGHAGRMHVFMRSSGNGCAPQAAALAHGRHVPHAAPPAHVHRPANALPPPSPLLQADFQVPGHTRATG